MGHLLKGLPSWYLAPQKSMEQKNQITVLILVIHKLRADQLCWVTYTNSYLPQKSETSHTETLFNSWPTYCIQWITSTLETSGVTKPSITVVKWPQDGLVNDICWSWISSLGMNDLWKLSWLFRHSSFFMSPVGLYKSFLKWFRPTS